jgi:hypothetical protein
MQAKLKATIASVAQSHITPGFACSKKANKQITITFTVEDPGTEITKVYAQIGKQGVFIWKGQESGRDKDRDHRTSNHKSKSTRKAEGSKQRNSHGVYKSSHLGTGRRVIRRSE